MQLHKPKRRQSKFERKQGEFVEEIADTFRAMGILEEGKRHPGAVLSPASAPPEPAGIVEQVEEYAAHRQGAERGAEASNAAQQWSAPQVAVGEAATPAPRVASGRTWSDDSKLAPQAGSVKSGTETTALALVHPRGFCEALATQEHVDVALSAIDYLDAIERWQKNAKQQVREALIDWIGRNGAIEVGDVRWYARDKSSEKCLDLKAAALALFEALGGDVGAFIDCLASDALKKGALKRIPGFDFEQFFETTIEQELVPGKPNKPKRELASANTRYLPK